MDNFGDQTQMQSKSTGFKNPLEAAELDTYKVVERYTIKTYQLGRGSFAKTYLALKDKCQEILACKMIVKKDLLQKIAKSDSKASNRDLLTKTIKNEAFTWKELEHQNIVRFKDFAQTENNVYFFLEYCADGSLEMLLRRKPLPEKEAIKLFKQIVDGCEYLYDRGIFHRDLKPENILIQDGCAKISDFGLAKLVEEDDLKNNSLLRTNVGTPVYMSPQILMGEAYSIKCDVWSLGVIFYKVLFGILPWESVENFQALIACARSRIRFSPAIQVNPSLKQLIVHMLSFEERERVSIKQVKKLLNKVQSYQTQ